MKKQDQFDFDSDKEIDESALDIEWLDQTSIAAKYGHHWAHLNKKVKKLRERKKTIRSELILKANQNPEECCYKTKPNAADIEAFYRTQPEYQSIVDELIDLEYELEYADIAKNEISFTRKAALENLVTLHGQMYFAGPKVPRDLIKERESKNKFMTKIKRGLNKGNKGKEK